MLILLACTDDAPTETAEPAACEEITSYRVPWTAEPSPLVAGEESEFTLTVQAQDGCPVDTLQQSHERMVHTLFVSEDLSSFQHVHHEDFYGDPGYDAYIAATFHFPVTFPLAGRYLAVFDYAHRDQWLQSTDLFEVTGSPAQAPTPEADYATERDAADVHVALSWDEGTPVTGYDVGFSVRITDAATGQDVADLVQWLGADAHMAAVDAALSAPGHTHAWSPGMETMTPGMSMPPRYQGDYVPFRYTFTEPGLHAMWVQFTRAAAPDEPYVVPFTFDVAP